MSAQVEGQREVESDKSITELAEELAETLEDVAMRSLSMEDRRDQWREWTRELKSPVRKYTNKSSGAIVTFREVFLHSTVLEKVVKGAFQKSAPPKEEFTELLSGCLCTGEGQFTKVLVDQLWNLLPLAVDINSPGTDPDKKYALQKLVEVLVECFTLFKAVPTDLARVKQLALDKITSEPTKHSAATNINDLLRYSQSQRTFIADVLAKPSLQSSNVKYSKKTLLQRVQLLQDFIDNKIKYIQTEKDDIKKEEHDQTALFKSGMNTADAQRQSLEAEVSRIELKRAELTSELETLRQSELSVKTKIKELTNLKRELSGAHSRVTTEIRNHSETCDRIESELGKESDSIKKFTMFVQGSHKLASEFAKKCLEKKIDATRNAYCSFLKSAQPRLKVCHQVVADLKKEVEVQSQVILKSEGDDKSGHIETLTQTVSRARELVMSATCVEHEIKTWEQELSVSGKLKDIDIGETPNCIFSSLEGIDKLNKSISDIAKAWVPVKSKRTKPRRSYHRTQSQRASFDSDFPTVNSDISFSHSYNSSSVGDFSRCNSSTVPKQQQHPT